MATGQIQLGNVIATPTASTTQAQASAAQSAGWAPVAPAPATGFKVSPTGGRTYVDSQGNPTSDQSGASIYGTSNGPTASIPGGHTASSYVVPAYNAATGAGSLSGIARELGITTAALLQANPDITNPNVLYKGQKLNVPQANAPTTGYTPSEANPPASTVGFGSSGTNAVTTPNGTNASGTQTPLTDQEIKDLQAQGYNEGDNVPGRGVLQPDGTFSNPPATGTTSTGTDTTGTGTTAPVTTSSDTSAYVQGSGAQRTQDQQTADQIAAVTNYYADQSGVIKATHDQAQSTIDNYITELQKRNDAEVANINASFDLQGQQLVIKQAQTVGQTSMGLARMGGYLGDSASGISYLNALNNSNQLAVTAMTVARNQAVQDANNAIADKSFAAAQAKVSEAKAYNDSINALYKQTFDQVQDIQNNNLNRQKTYLDNQSTMASQMAAGLAGQFNGDAGHDRALAEKMSTDSGGQVSADALMTAARDYQLKVQTVTQAGTHFFPVNDPITGQPISVTKVNPDGTTQNLSLQQAYQSGYTPLPSGTTGVSGSGGSGTGGSGTGGGAPKNGQQVSAASDGGEYINGQEQYFRTLTSNNFKTDPTGKGYVDISGSPNQSIAMLEAKRTGLPVVTSAKDSSDLIQASKALQAVDDLQTDFNQLAPTSNSVGAKYGTAIQNNWAPVADTTRNTKLKSYLDNQNRILGIIGTDAGGQPRTTGNLINLTAGGIPKPLSLHVLPYLVPTYSGDSQVDGNIQFNKIRDQITSVYDTVLGTKTDPNDVYSKSAANVARLTKQKYPESAPSDPFAPTAHAATTNTSTPPVAGFGWNP
jgi:hypothetical protein